MPIHTSKAHSASEKESTTPRKSTRPQQVPSVVPPDALQQAVADPEAARPADILTLQRRYGNQSVQRLLGRPTLQAKLTVGPAADAYEQEADRVANQVMVMSAPQPAKHQPAVQRAAEEEEEVQTKPLVQRQAEEEEEVQTKPLVQRQAEEEEEVQTKPLVQRQAEEEEEVQTKPLVQRQAEEEEEVQTKRLLQRQAEEEEEVQTKRQDPRAGFEAGSAIEGHLHSQKGHGSPLPGDVLTYMEPRFGADFSGVRVHTGSEASQLNRQLSAQAFTHGQDIYLGEGQYSPGTTAGRQLLAHELTHVVQQTGGVQRRETAPAASLPTVKIDATAGPQIQRVYTGVNMSDENSVKQYLERRFTELKGKWTRKSTRKTKATNILSHTPALYRALVREIYERLFGGKIIEPTTFAAEKVEPHSPAGSGKMATIGKTAAAGVGAAIGLALAIPLAPLALIGYGIYKLTKITTTWTEKDLEKHGFTKEEISNVRKLDLGFGPNEAKRAAKKRYNANKADSLLSGDQLGAIASLWASKNGPGWLATAGFQPTSQVEAYARGGNFRDWENLPPAFKMQVATMQYYLGDAGLKDFQNTPGYWKGQSVHGEKEAVHKRDVESWQKTLVAPSKEALEEKLGTGADKTKVTQEFGSVGALQTQNAAAVQIVKRLFIILQKGLAYSEKKGEEFKAWEAPVAVALSHGGRVNIRIPKAAQAGQEHALFNWLMGGEGGMKMAHVYERTAGTHRVAIGKDTKTKKGSFKEKKGFGAAINAMLGTEMGDTFHYGLDVPVGGTGQKDLNGDVILPNGAYGHLYIGYKPPTLNRDGALLIGCETDAPGKTNALGHKHTAKATSAEFSSTGGAKKDKIGMEKGGMLVDLNQLQPVGNDWMGQLKQMEQDVTDGNVTLAQLVGKRLDQAE